MHTARPPSRGPLQRSQRPARWRRSLSRSIEALGATRLLILGFVVIIAIGTLLLCLPVASARETPLTWDEALFTSTSATTVTGLSVVSTANDVSLVGQWIIIALMQVGGVGFIAFSVLLFRLIGRRVTVHDRLVLSQSLGGGSLADVGKLAMMVLAVTVAVEAVGALLFFLRWKDTMPPASAAYRAIFHAISSYCNAGFDLFGKGGAPYFGYGADPWTLSVSAMLILIGGLGAPVLFDLWNHRLRGPLSLNTRLTLFMTVALTAIGVALLWSDAALAGKVEATRIGWRELLVGTYTVISARTAGLTVIDLEQLQPATQLMLAVWMFIGGGSASMAGGISTNTVAVILVAVYATVRGAPQAAIFGRALPDATVRQALAVGAVSIMFVVVCTMLLVRDVPGTIFSVGFEAISAFSNTGFSLGATSQLSTEGRLLVAFIMFWGRLGPLTIVVALAQRERPLLARYPEEPVIMG